MLFIPSPMENQQEILALGEVELVEYLNRMHRVPDYFLIETQKHNMEKYHNCLNEQMRLAFTANSEPLLEILNTYQYCQDILFTCRVPRFVGGKQEDAIETPGHREFQRKCRYFTESISPFIVPGRDLVCDAMFEEDRYYLLLTNDLLFLGERTGNPTADATSEFSGFYDLKHAASSRHVSLEERDGAVFVSFPGDEAEYVLGGDRTSVENFCESFRDTVPEPQEDVSDEESDQKKDGILKYYLETEQLGKMKMCAGMKMGTRKDGDGIWEWLGLVDDGLSCAGITSVGELREVLEAVEEREKVLAAFVVMQYQNGIEEINRIQELSGLISDLFDYFVEFVHEIKGVYEELKVDEMHHLLVVEELVLATFDSLEHRLFSKIHEVEDSTRHLVEVEKRLLFDGYDYRYLMEKLEERRSEFAEKCLEEAKMEIHARIEQLEL